MRHMERRLADLEARESKSVAVWRRVIQRAGQSLDEAMASCGVVLGPGERLIVREIVSPTDNGEVD